MYMKKTLLLFFVTFIFLGACQKSSIDFNSLGNSPGVSDSEILIGVSAPFSGVAKNLGVNLTNGSLAYLNMINEKGGVNGRKISLKILDDSYKPSKTLSNTKELIRKLGVFMLFDYVGTPTSKNIVKYINKNKIPILGLFTGAEFLRNPVQPYIFNVRASYFQEVEKIILVFLCKTMLLDLQFLLVQKLLLRDIK